MNLRILPLACSAVCCRRCRSAYARGLQPLVPTAVSLQERLAAFPTDGLPLERPVVIRWNEHQVPFIEAETDHDLAFAFGMVHAHLRGGQIALFKRFFYGRLSEMAGPFARDLDHAIRILDYGHAADEWERRMPEETRDLGAGVRRRAERLPGADAACRRRSSRCWASSPSLTPSATFSSDAALPAPTLPGSTTSRCWSAAASPALPHCGTARWRPARRRSRAPGRTSRRASSRTCC